MRNRKRVVLVRLAYCLPLWGAWGFFAFSPMTRGDPKGIGGLLSLFSFLLALFWTRRILFLPGQPAVPVLMYHSIAPDQLLLPWKEIILPPDLFENQMAYLARHGFTALTLRDLFAARRESEPLPSKPIVLTFDDGFLDNWVFAYPILKKHGLKGTFFVSTDFVDRTEEYRPNLESVWTGQAAQEMLDWRGYLSWRELREMVESGVVDVQSHGTTHTWNFQGERIVDFHHPGDGYIWLGWNEHPEKKPESLKQDLSRLVAWGVPIYAYDRSLLGRQLHPDEGLRRHLVGWIGEHGRGAFFEKRGWTDELCEIAREYRRTSSQGEGLETEEEYWCRVKGELAGSKATIEAMLRKKVDFFCWPGDRWNGTLRKAAVEELGYLATTWDDGFNARGEDPRNISRFFVGRLFGDRTPRFLDHLYFLWLVSFARGRLAWAFLLYPMIFVRDLFRKVVPYSMFYPSARRRNRSC